MITGTISPFMLSSFNVHNSNLGMGKFNSSNDFPALYKTSIRKLSCIKARASINLKISYI